MLNDPLLHLPYSLALALSSCACMCIHSQVGTEWINIWNKMGEKKRSWLVCLLYMRLSFIHTQWLLISLSRKIQLLIGHMLFSVFTHTNYFVCVFFWFSFSFFPFNCLRLGARATQKLTHTHARCQFFTTTNRMRTRENGDLSIVWNIYCGAWFLTLVLLFAMLRHIQPIQQRRRTGRPKVKCNKRRWEKNRKNLNGRGTDHFRFGMSFQLACAFILSHLSLYCLPLHHECAVCCCVFDGFFSDELWTVWFFKSHHKSCHLFCGL